jgi:hypothetical protein
MAGPGSETQVANGTALSGTVVDEEGRPVHGARMLATSFDGGERRVQNTMTNVGVFKFADFAFGKSEIKVTHPDYCPLTVHSTTLPENGQKPITLTLSRGATVQGHVYDANGKPMPGTTMFLQRHQYYHRSGGAELAEYDLVTTVTDKNGRYEVDRFPEDDCYVTLDRDWRATGVTQQMIRTRSGQSHTLDFGGQAKTTGRLLVNGRPLSGAIVWLSGVIPETGPLRASVVSDAKGEFVFRGLPAGQRTLFYRLLDQKREWVADTIRIGPVDIPAEGVNLGDVESTAAKVVIRSQPANAPGLAEAEFLLERYNERYTASGDGGWPRPSQADRAIFEHVPVGKYELTCRRPNQLQVHKVVEVTAAPAVQVIDLNLPLGTASLHGTCEGLKGENGEPGRYAVCRLWSKDRQLMAHLVPKISRYEINNIPPGVYVLTRTNRRSADELVEVSLAENENKVLDLTPEIIPQKSTEATGYRFVYLYRPNGAPLVGCDIRFAGAESPDRIGSKDGKLIFSGDAGAKYEMTITYPGFKPVHQKLELLPVQINGQTVTENWAKVFEPVSERDRLRIYLQNE